jgi:membrane protease subunit (stomatin/prohibitin family)
MSAIGNLNDYVKFQMAQGLEKGEGGTGSAAAQLGIGLAMAQQLAGQFNQPPQAPPPLAGQGSPSSAAPPQLGAAASAAAAGLPKLYSPADIAQTLGVTEADVITSLEAGELKGKKIGSAWRITQGALDDFLRH